MFQNRDSLKITQSMLTPFLCVCVHTQVCKCACSYVYCYSIMIWLYSLLYTVEVQSIAIQENLTNQLLELPMIV